jgi:hypothetical protein
MRIKLDIYKKITIHFYILERRRERRKKSIKTQHLCHCAHAPDHREDHVEMLSLLL